MNTISDIYTSIAKRREDRQLLGLSEEGRTERKLIGYCRASDYIDSSLITKLGLAADRYFSGDFALASKNYKDYIIKIKRPNYIPSDTLDSQWILVLRNRVKPDSISLFDDFKDLSQSSKLGLEIEFQGNNEIRSDKRTRHTYARTLDCVADAVGIMPQYDAIREYAMPPGTTLSNVQTIQSLDAMGLMQEANMHLNWGGIPNSEKLIKQLLLLNLVFSVGAVFNEPIEDFEIPLHSQKKVYARSNEKFSSVVFDDDSVEQEDTTEIDSLPKGYPIRIRESGVIEFRDLVQSWNGIKRFGVGIFDLTLAMESLSAFSKVKFGDSTDVKDIELANLWMKFEKETIELLENENLTANGSSAYPIERHLELTSRFCEYKILAAKASLKNASNEDADQAKKELLSVALEGEWVLHQGRSEEDYMCDLEHVFSNSEHYNLLWNRLIRASKQPNSKLRTELNSVVRETRRNTIKIQNQ